MQNAPADAYDGMNITESADAIITKSSEYYTERVSTTEADEPFVVGESRVEEQEILVEPESLKIAGGGNGDVSAMHEEISLERFNGLDHMDADESRDASHDIDFDGFHENHESGTRTFRATRPHFFTHIWVDPLV